jgi:signal transduction histidine kinase
MAEDDPVSRRLLETYLNRWGHDVTVASNGLEAWRLFDGGDFWVVISDWTMPELDGVELIRRIRSGRQSHYVYCILVTARSQKEDVVEGMEAGADDFVTKPFDRDELRVRLRAGERIVQLEQNLAAQNRALREAQATIIQSEKLAGLGRLAAGIAHEINNPLAYVTNNLSVLRRDVPAGFDVLQKYRGTIEIIRQAEPNLATELIRAESEIDLPYIQENVVRQIDDSMHGLARVRDIVRNLLGFARPDQQELLQLDVNTAVLGTAEIIAHEFKTRHVQLKTDFQPVPLLLCYPGKINQVLLNLMLNAAQACQIGGTVWVRTHQETSGQVIVEVEDDGCGIGPEQLPHIFEPFFTTKPVGHGTGLGLYVSYGIAREHGGSIEVDSAVGRGSIFRLRLPGPERSVQETGD